MKLIVAALTLLAVQTASANLIDVSFVPCTGDQGKVCAKVYKDYTTNKSLNGREMNVISEGMVFDQLNQNIEKIAGKQVIIEGALFEVFNGQTLRLKVDRFVNFGQARNVQFK